MVANIGPADWNYDETISTLRYANRAKNIKNKPRINEDPKDAMMREFQDKIAELKAQVGWVRSAGLGPGGSRRGHCRPPERPVSLFATCSWRPGRAAAAAAAGPLLVSLPRWSRWRIRRRSTRSRSSCGGRSSKRRAAPAVGGEGGSKRSPFPSNSASSGLGL